MASSPAGGLLARYPAPLPTEERVVPTRETLEANADATTRLEELLGRLTDDQLEADLGGGWRVSTALGHMAFWDFRAVVVLKRWIDTGTPYVELDDDVVNGALEPLIIGMQPRTAVALCLEAARHADSVVESVPDGRVPELALQGGAYLLERFRHRSEHIDQIQAAVT